MVTRHHAVRDDTHVIATIAIVVLPETVYIEGIAAALLAHSGDKLAVGYKQGILIESTDVLPVVQLALALV